MSHPADMSQAEADRVAEMRARVHAVLGAEAVAFIAQLAREGLITGWRNVSWVGTPDEALARNAAIAARSITAGEFLSRRAITRENFKWTS